jgi:hypothetical protein
MRIVARHALAFTLAALLVPSAAPALTLDAFTDALPPNPCLPVTGQGVVFAGSYCDGASCPPGLWVTCASSDVVQVGLPGVHAGTQRLVEAIQWHEDGSVNVRIDPSTQRLHGVLDLATEAGIQLGYGTPYAFTQDPDALNLDLVALGAVGIRFAVDGTMSAQQPLLVAINLLADGPNSPRPSAWAVRLLEEPGTVLVPLTDFTPGMPSFTMADVDDIQIWISNCPEYIEGCSGSTYTPMAFTLGPVEIVSGPTPVVPRTWGSVKAGYR